MIAVKLYRNQIRRKQARTFNTDEAFVFQFKTFDIALYKNVRYHFIIATRLFGKVILHDTRPIEENTGRWEKVFHITTRKTSVIGHNQFMLYWVQK